MERWNGTERSFSEKRIFYNILIFGQMTEIIGGIITEAILDGLRYIYYRVRFGKKYKEVLAERDRHHHERMYRSPQLQIVIILLVLTALALLVGSIYAGVNQFFLI